MIRQLLARPGLVAPELGGADACSGVCDAAKDALFRFPRSSTEFVDEPVTDEHLRAIYDLAKMCPTAFNQQPLRIFAIRSADARRRLAGHMIAHNRERAMKAPLVLLLAADNNFHHNLPKMFPHSDTLESYFENATDERRHSAEFNSLIQVGVLIMAIRAEGFAVGPIRGYDHAAVDAEFFPDGSISGLLAMNVGRPLPKSRPRLPRLNFTEAVVSL